MPSGCSSKTAAAHDKAVAALLRTTPQDWLALEAGYREDRVGACVGSELLVSLFHAPHGLQVAGLQVVS